MNTENLFYEILKNFTEQLGENIQVNVEPDYISIQLEIFPNTKEIIANYKKNLDMLDDCMFVDMMEELSSIIDLQKFDQLLDKEELTEEEEINVLYYIKLTNALTREYIKEKIDELTELLDNF